MKKRLFIAIKLSGQLKKEVLNFQNTLAQSAWPVRWTKPNNLHLTLVFLGWLPYVFPRSSSDFQSPACAGQNHSSSQQLITKGIQNAHQIDHICQLVSSSTRPFILRLQGLGAFPQLSSPRVIWLGLRGNLTSLAILAQKLQTQLKAQGFKIPPQNFQPHLTIARIQRSLPRQRVRDLGAKILSLNHLRFLNSIKVNKIILYQSKLSRSGARYLEITAFPFS